jgi:hypothetical protein
LRVSYDCKTRLLNIKTVLEQSLDNSIWQLIWQR